MSGYVPPRGDLEGGEVPSTLWQRVALGAAVVAVLAVLLYLGLR